ncbi:MAG: hypothetical protein MJE68_04905 [Proteobacteria bacterium]|nr:hypothetical protein [Pseudomonadota bacterium]
MAQDFQMRSRFRRSSARGNRRRSCVCRPLTTTEAEAEMAGYCWRSVAACTAAKTSARALRASGPPKICPPDTVVLKPAMTPPG